MATYRRRNGRVNVLVRQGDKQYSKTFDTKTEAKMWAAGFERHLKNSDKHDAPVMRKETFAMVMQAYKRLVTPTKSRAYDEVLYLDRLSAARFANIDLRGLELQHLADYRDHRLNVDGVSPATVDRDFRIMKVVASYAPELGFPDVPVSLFKKVPLPRATERPIRRVTDEEFAGLLWGCKPSNPRRTDNALYMEPLLKLALATGMRRGELCQLDWSWVNRDLGTITLPSAITKTARQRVIPIMKMAEEALDALESLYGSKGKVLGDFTVIAVDLAWKRIKKRSGVDCRFHDLRHEAISHFFELGCTVPEVMTISGHKTVAALDIYTHANTSSLIARLKGA